MILTQPVLLQSFQDEFGVEPGDPDCLPAKPGHILKKEDGELLSAERATKYRKGVGKLVYLARWSRPDILNAVREVARQNQAPRDTHYEAMLKIMKYCVSTPDLGLRLHVNRPWDGSRNHEFVIEGHSDSNYAQCTETRKSVSGNTTTLDGSPVVTRSVMQDTIKLSVTEAELDSAVTNVQDMLHVKNVLEGIGLKVKKPMTLYVDNQGVREIVNNWTVGGRTRHIAVKQMFLRELKETGALRVIYEQTSHMPSDIFTKNAQGSIFRKHRDFFMGSINKLWEQGKDILKSSKSSARESVGSGKCQNDQAYVKKGALTVEDEQLTKLANEQTSGNAHVKGNFTLRHEKPMVNIRADGPDRKPDGKDIQYKSGLANSRDMVDERLNDLG